MEEKEKFESKIIEVMAITIVVITILFVLSYQFFFSGIYNFTAKYGWYSLYTIILVVANATTIYHLKAYRNAVTCMAGMMMGMTIGMIAGLSFGYIVGATNGMFTGSVYGMVVGMITGAWCGKCCGIMGLMEGVMAGLMGGTMGPMLSVMMLNDRILLFTPIFVLSCILILVGLGYMVYKEHSLSEEKVIKPYPLSVFVITCILAVLITLLIMIYGPKASIFI